MVTTPKPMPTTEMPDRGQYNDSTEHNNQGHAVLGKMSVNPGKPASSGKSGK